MPAHLPERDRQRARHPCRDGGQRRGEAHGRHPDRGGTPPPAGRSCPQMRQDPRRARLRRPAPRQQEDRQQRIETRGSAQPDAGERDELADKGARGHAGDDGSGAGGHPGRPGHDGLAPQPTPTVAPSSTPTGTTESTTIHSRSGAPPMRRRRGGAEHRQGRGREKASGERVHDPRRAARCGAARASRALGRRRVCGQQPPHTTERPAVTATGGLGGHHRRVGAPADRPEVGVDLTGPQQAGQHQLDDHREDGGTARMAQDDLEVPDHDRHDHRHEEERAEHVPLPFASHPKLTSRSETSSGSCRMTASARGCRPGRAA